MLCSQCQKNEATVYYKQNINGQVTEYALCPQCAAKVQGIHLDGMNLFGSLLGRPHAVGTPKKHCTLCGSTFESIRRSGKVGCAQCYEVFREQLAPMIHSLHSGTHIGRAPKGFAEKRKAEDELSRLRGELKSAIEKENYEEAARLRDLIKAKEAEQ